MNQPIRRRRRRRVGDSDPLNFSLISGTEIQAESSTEPTDNELKNDHPPSNIPQTSVDSTTTKQMTIDRIRSEINEDNYYSQLNEPDYSNDTHDWSDNFESASSDYWHFLGRYE